MPSERHYIYSGALDGFIIGLGIMLLVIAYVLSQYSSISSSEVFETLILAFVILLFGVLGLAYSFHKASGPVFG